jgi:hypothetical protein
MIMVIIVVERIKRSRREEVDGSQLKWAVDRSKRNVKGMSRELEKGNPYSSDKSKKVACARHCSWSPPQRANAGSGKRRVWTQRHRAP